jgi:hypothetical protein
LCGSGLAYDPRANGRRYTFGVSGLLYQQNLLVFDRETESLWSQLQGEAVAGPLAGTSLRLLPMTMRTWQSWRAEHPQTLVLSSQTGYKRDYSRDPYRNWLLDRRIALVISINGETKIYPFSELKKAGPVLRDDLAGLMFTVLFDAKEQSATVQASSGDSPPHFVLSLEMCGRFSPMQLSTRLAEMASHTRLLVRFSP